MDDDQRLMSAITTEHYVLQAAATTTTNEANSRASMYLLALSSSLVAIGFASNAPEALGPLVATLLPAMLALGFLTLIRLVDISSEYRQYLVGIAHIRGYYRSLGPTAAAYFAPERGRWPEPGAPNPSLDLGRKVGFLTTASTMIAVINSFVGGAAATILARWLGTGWTLGLGLGVVAAVVLMAAFLLYQRWRFALFERVTEPA